MSIFTRLKTFLFSNKRTKAKVSTLTDDYQKLIEEFRLIQEKKSKLSKRERDFVELRIKHLIHKGHLNVNK